MKSRHIIIREPHIELAYDSRLNSAIQALRPLADDYAAEPDLSFYDLGEGELAYVVEMAHRSSVPFNKESFMRIFPHHRAKLR